MLLDVMMPQVDGWEMLQRVQERHGVGSIPVLMFSGKVDAASAQEASSRGAQGFIGKPFDPQQLIESAKQMLPS
jgi:CheY-like chemotaxis protein